VPNDHDVVTFEVRSMTGSHEQRSSFPSCEVVSQLSSSGRMWMKNPSVTG
jgi:hypothetical protein